MDKGDVSWMMISTALVLLLGGILGGLGVMLFTRRELATAQGTS